MSPMICGDGYVVRNEPYGEKCRRMTIATPYRGSFQPGQFVHLQVTKSSEIVLRRPFSIYEITPYKGALTNIDILYAVVGRGTKLLAEKQPLETVGFLGPLGNGFRVDARATDVFFVAGGIGIVPFLPLIREYVRKRSKARLTLLFGARTADELHGLRDFEDLPIAIRTSTDDGSHGTKGLVTVLLERELARRRKGRIRIHSCGPEKMMEAVAAIARRRKIPCELSLEKRMGCGLGACRACVVRLAGGNGGVAYSRTCVDGPVYNADEIVL